uniref:Uncharacterized protein n=1 Tax=Anguilla anguilla TaxID=7936 RepID=A0A0E9Q7T2_ANGAN
MQPSSCPLQKYSGRVLFDSSFTPVRKLNIDVANFAVLNCHGRTAQAVL